jgi:hypothetical protein
MASGSRQGFQHPSASSQALGRAREGNNNEAENEHSIPLQSCKYTQSFILHFDVPDYIPILAPLDVHIAELKSNVYSTVAPSHHRVVAKSSANADEPRRKTTQTEIVDGELEVAQDIDIVLDEVERDDELREVQRDVDRPVDEEAQNDARREIDRGLLGWYRIRAIVNFGISFFSDSWHAILLSSTYRAPLPDTLLDGEDVFVHQPPIAWERFRTLLFNRLIAFLGLVVWIFNISTALGYVMLMNDPTPPKPSFIIGYTHRLPNFLMT